MNKYLRLLLWVTVLFFMSCGKQIPGDIIQPAEMEDLLYDYHLALTMGNELSYTDRYKRELYKNYVFDKHGVTEAEFDSSMVWYTRNSIMLTDIYKNLQKRYEIAEEQMRSELNKRSGQISVSQSGDSVDVWSDRNIYWLTSSPFTNRLMFDLKADTTFHIGDVLVFEADYNFLSYEKNSAKAIIAMNITFKNDSTQGISKVVNKSGKWNLTIKPDSAFEYKSINGFVYFNNPDSTETSVLINKIRLMRYRVGKTTGQMAQPDIKPLVESTESEDKKENVSMSDRKIRRTDSEVKELKPISSK